MCRIFLTAFVFFSFAVWAQESSPAPADNSVVIPNTGTAAPTSPLPSTNASGNAMVAVPPQSTAKKMNEAPGGASQAVKTGGSFRERLDRANALLKKGDTEGALGQYRDLQTDDPESPLLYYNIGCAAYQRGMQEIELKAAQDAVASFSQAKTSFEKARLASDPELRTNAGFNHANTFAREAEQAAAAGKYEESIKAFQGTVQAYEDFLKEHPTHQGAKKNLDYVRYRLKSMMQNPPPPPKDDKNQQKQDQEQKQDQQKQDKKEGEQQEKKDNESQKSPEQQQQDKQEKKEGEQSEPKENKQEEKQQQAKQEDASQKDAQEQATQQEQAKDGAKDEHQNVEAILQSLEDVDKREQKEVRNQRTGVGIRKEWW